MKYKTSMIIMFIAIFLFSISATCAADIDETSIATEDSSQMELSINDKIQAEDNNLLTQKDNDETVGAGTDNEILATGEGSYSDLRDEIDNGGDKNLTKKYYTYTVSDGNTIVINTPGVINGNGAVIDMAGSNIRAFHVSASGVTINNLTIINANYDGDGGAIYFSSLATSGTVSNCNFVNNTASGWGGAIMFGGTGTVSNCNFVDNKATGDYRYGGAVYFRNVGEVINCNFINNKATGIDSWGGAVYFYQGTGSVTNCNFAGNTATRHGGAVYFENSGNVTNCNFTDNSAYSFGGAVYFVNNGSVTNCNFTGNTATHYGGAVYFDGTGTVTNCNFTNNSAVEGGAIFSRLWYTTADTCIFKRNSEDNENTVIYPPTLNVNNFTTVYGSGEKLTFDLKTNSSIPVPNGNILISVYFKDNGEWVRNYTCLSGEGWIPDLPVGSYIAFFDTEYAKFQKINRTVTITMPNVRYSINVSSVTTNNKTVNITAKTDIPKNILWEGKLLFILPNNTSIAANYSGEGIWWAEHIFDEYGEYEVSASYIGLTNVTVNNATIAIDKANSTLTIDDIVFDYGGVGSTAVNYTNASGVNVSVVGQPQAVVDVVNNTITVSGLDVGTYTLSVTTVVDDDHSPVTQTANITVNKAKTVLTADAVTTTYNVNKYLVITLKDKNGIPLKDVSISVDLNGVKTYNTDSNGQVKVPTKGLAPKSYTAKITFKGNTNYEKSTKEVKVTVKKVASKITAAKKTFKSETKVKKYAAVLKDNAGKAIKNAKLALKVKGKTYSAKTNSKGKAVFKITNLNKKGSFKAVIKFNGNKYYAKSTKNVKIAVKSTFKTVSKGSKDKKTVKKIQQALKDHGYYITYKGHYLKVDGKYESCTARSVKEFQRDHGLKVTGKVDYKTAKKLKIV